MKKLLFLFVLLPLCITAFAQSSCYNHRIGEADKSYNSAEKSKRSAADLVSKGKNDQAVAKYKEAKQEYEKAKDYYEASLECVDAPANTSYASNRLTSSQNNLKEVKKILKDLSCPSLVLSNSNLAFDYTRNSKQVTVEGGEWSYKCSDSWLTVTKNGNSLSVSVTENSSKNSRSSSIEVTSCGNQKKNISVFQSGQEPYITLGAYSISFGQSGGSRTVTAQTNSNASIRVENTSTWLSTNCNGSSITFNCMQNNTRKSRTASVVVASTHGVSKSVNVSQEGKHISMPFDYASVRLLASFDLSVGFEIHNDGYIEASLGMWNLFWYGASAFGATVTYNRFVEIGDFYLYFGGGLGLGAAGGFFSVKVGALAGIEYALPSLDQLAFTFDYRPEIGRYYSNFINFNFGAKWYFNR